MPLRHLLLALSLSLSGCASTPPQPAPAVIPPPPVALTFPCADPADLAKGATGQDMGDRLLQWIGTAGCERAKRRALIESWPK